MSFPFVEHQAPLPVPTDDVMVARHLWSRRYEKLGSGSRWRVARQWEARSIHGRRYGSLRVGAKDHRRARAGRGRRNCRDTRRGWGRRKLQAPRDGFSTRSSVFLAAREVADVVTIDRVFSTGAEPEHEPAGIRAGHAVIGNDAMSQCRWLAFAAVRVLMSGMGRKRTQRAFRAEPPLSWFRCRKETLR